MAMLMAMLMALAPLAAPAQVPSDVPRNHWAYSAVEDLASKGLIKGYPPSSDFFGKRTVTRYEMATIVQRALARVDELLAGKADKGGERAVSPAQLDEVRRLVAEYKTELVVIGTDLQKVKDQIGALKEGVDAAKDAAQQAKDAAAKAASDAARAQQAADQAKQGVQSTIDALAEQRARIDSATAVAKTVNSHKISGYIQGRFEAFDTGRTSLFTPAAAGGAGNTPTAGGPAVGGPWNGFQVRRARLKVTGPITDRTDYALQVDFPSSGAFNLKDAWVSIADAPFKGVDLIAGQFLTPFGFDLNNSSASRESPERSLAFSDSNASSVLFRSNTGAAAGATVNGSVLPLFLNQEYDAGLQLSWFASREEKARRDIGDEFKTRAQLAVINGEGTTAGGIRNLNNGLDVVGRVQTSFFNHTLALGISGYTGSIPVRAMQNPPAGTTPGFVNAVRLLGGIDLHYRTPWKTLIRAEYVGGVQETTPDRGAYLENNHVQGYYIQLRHPVTDRLDLVTKYEEYMPISQAGKFAGPGGFGRMSLLRKAVHLGLLYQMDSATRFRLWYEKGLTPYDPTAVAGPLRDRLGLITGEVQVKY